MIIFLITSDIKASIVSAVSHARCLSNDFKKTTQISMEKFLDSLGSFYYYRSLDVKDSRKQSFLLQPAFATKQLKDTVIVKKKKKTSETRKE